MNHKISTIVLILIIFIIFIGIVNSEFISRRGWTYETDDDNKVIINPLYFNMENKSVYLNSTNGVLYYKEGKVCTDTNNLCSSGADNITNYYNVTNIVGNVSDRLKNGTDANLVNLNISTLFKVANLVNISSSGDVNATAFYGNGAGITGITSSPPAGAYNHENFTTDYGSLGGWKSANFTAIHSDNSIHNYYTKANFTSGFNDIYNISDSGLYSYANFSSDYTTYGGFKNENITSLKLGNTTAEIRSVFGNSSNITYNQETGAFSINMTIGSGTGTDGTGGWVNNSINTSTTLNVNLKNLTVNNAIKSMVNESYMEFSANGDLIIWI